MHLPFSILYDAATLLRMAFHCVCECQVQVATLTLNNINWKFRQNLYWNYRMAKKCVLTAGKREMTGNVFAWLCTLELKAKREH